MRLTMSEKRVLIKTFAPRYQKSRKKVKGELLTEFTQMSGYNRCYAAYLLRHHGKRIWVSRKVVAVADARKKVRRKPAKKYDPQADLADTCVANVWPPWPQAAKELFISVRGVK